MPTVTTYPGVFGPYSPITFTRASTATYFNSAGVLTSAAINTPRLDYDPSTLAAQGVLVEEARTNSIRNNTMQGAAAGTPGTLPTNWVVSTTGAATYQVVGTGTENGINYMDVRFQGAGGGDTWNLIYDTTIVAANGQTWTSSVYLKLAGGSAANIPLVQRMVFRDSGFLNIQAADTSAITPTSAGLATQRSTLSLTATQAATAFVTSQLNSSTPTGAYDITLRIGLPQLEGGLGSSVNSGTASGTTTAVVLSAGSATDDIYNGNNLFVNGQYRVITDYVGSTKTATVSPALSVSPSGSYTVFAVGNAAFATSVIPTSGSALTRAADVASVNTLSLWFNAAESTILTDYTILTSRTTDVFFARFDDGSDANRIQAGTGASFTVFNSFVVAANVSQGTNTVSVNPLGTHKTAFAVTTNDSITAADGSVGAQDTTVTLPSGLNRFSLGNSNTILFMNGWLRRITYYPRRLSNAELQAITA